MSSLEQILPSFHHREVHSRWIDAPPEAVWRALHDVRFDELPVGRAGLAVRSLPARLLGRAEHPPVGTFLAGMQARGFTVLAEEHGHELVAGSITVDGHQVEADLVIDASGLPAGPTLR